MCIHKEATKMSRFVSLLNPTYLRIALLGASLLVWALTGMAPDDEGCCG